MKRIHTDCSVSECDCEASIIRRPWPTGGCFLRSWRWGGLTFCVDVLCRTKPLAARGRVQSTWCRK